jgi:hypothetical protein
MKELVVVVTFGLGWKIGWALCGDEVSSVILLRTPWLRVMALVGDIKTEGIVACTCKVV